MRLYYIDESEGPRYYVRSALGVDGERWNELFADIYAWRLDLRDDYGIPLSRELHATDLLAGRGLLARNGDSNGRLTLQQGAEVFLGGLRRLEEAVKSIGGIEVINVCLHKPQSRRYEQGREEMISRLYQRLKVRNHVPSRYEAWEDGEKTRNIPIEQVIGGPAFRSSDSDYLLQMVDFIAHALLKQEEEPIPRVEEHGIDEAFRILDAALNRQASGRDPQGVVRR